MKIAIFTDTFIPKYDGIVTATLNLAKGIADRGHKIYIIAPKSQKRIKEFKYKNIKVIRVPSISARFYPGLRITNILSIKLMKYLKKEGINLIHFTTPMTLGLQAILISKALKIPLIGTFHVFFADEQYLKHGKLNFKSIQKIMWAYSRMFYNSCDLVTSPAETTKKEILSHGFKENIKVISNGIDPKKFINSKYKEVRKKYNKSGNLLLFVGRIAHEKNIFYLLECFSKVINKMPKTKLLVIGDGPQMKEVKQKIDLLNLKNNIILTGKIDYNTLVKSSIFKACDLFVTASVTENQPMTILEAQMNGLPCVTISERGMKDLIKNGYNGYLVQNGDKNGFANSILKILANKKLFKKMQKNTLESIKKHYLDKIIDEWEREYSNLINNYK
ncbi:MAG: glycosyltransferase [Candidatus Pacearchaeota archaeon]|jgi:1,2-diacylglycerol 3-alpha-glucosyltransferase